MTDYDGKLWNCGFTGIIKTFDWKIYNLILKAPVQTLLHNEELKENLGYVVSYY